MFAFQLIVKEVEERLIQETDKGPGTLQQPLELNNDKGTGARQIPWRQTRVLEPDKNTRDKVGLDLWRQSRDLETDKVCGYGQGLWIPTRVLETDKGLGA